MTDKITKDGVASHGSLSPAIIEDGFWLGWTPLPRRRK